ncbi:MAG: T9SS type B sorting domain-containing protein, partial [Bacteroidia bacterium]
PGIISSSFFTSLSKGYAAGLSGNMYKTIDGGTTWGTVASGTSALQTVEFTSTTDGVVCSQTGNIRRTTTSGGSWTAVTSGTSYALAGMDFYDANNGVIVGGSAPLDSGIILTTANSGVSWTIYNPNSSRLTKVDFYDANTGYAVGLDGTILKWSVPLPPAAPDASFTTSAPGCLGQTVNCYSVMAGTPGVTHSWNFGLSATPATSTATNPTGVTYSTYGAKMVTHIVTTSLGSDTVTNVITINPSPISSFSSTAPACPGATVNFSNTGTTGSGVTYSWDFGSGSSPLNSTSQFPTGIIYNSSGIKAVTISVTNQFGCTTSTTQNITINVAPLANAGMDSMICTGNSVQIGSPAIVGCSYSWSPSTALSNLSISNPVASPAAPNTQYVVTVTNTTTGCSNRDTVSISVIPPMSANAGADAEICKGDSVQIGTGAITGQIYSWSPGATLSDSAIASPQASPAVTTTYTLTVSGNGCSSATDLVTIVVHPKPVANAGADDTIAVGTSIQLNASGGEQYSWSPATGLDNPSIYNPIASPVVNSYYTVTVTNAYGCKSSDNLTILVFNSNFWVPTAFTPDGNGVDDIFYVRGEGIKNLEFTVFNRWGEQIFLSRDLNVGWDGTRQTTGEKLPEGAYVYQVKGINPDGTQLYAKGMINLIR